MGPTDTGCLLSRLVRAALYVVWPLAMAAQWAVVAPLSYLRGTFFSLEGDFESHTRLVPFARDYFFMIWNLLPFALAACIRLAERNVSRVVMYTTPDRVRRAAAGRVAEVVGRWECLMRGPLIIALAAAIALLGCWHQFVKIAQWRVTHSSVYWWQGEFSPTVFAVRLAALFINLFILVFALLALLALLHGFAALVRARLWTLDLLHMDGCGGVASYGKTAVVFTLVPFLAALTGLLGYFDHRGAGFVQSLGDASMLILASALGALTFIVPLGPIHRAMREKKVEACRLTQQAIHDLGPILPNVREVGLDHDRMRVIREQKENRDALLGIHRLYKKAPTWPFNLAIWARIGGTLAGPLTVYVIDQIRKSLAR